MSIRKRGVELGSKSKQKQSQNNNDNKQPPTIIAEIVNNVKYEYCYQKTVHSLEELDDFRFKQCCKFDKVKQKPAFTRVTLYCTNRRMIQGMCPFSLMARRSHPKSSDIHVYAHSEHNHHVKSEVERAANRVPRNKLVPDANPPSSLTTPNGLKWTLLRTVRDQKKMQKFGLKHHCRCSWKKLELNRVSMVCPTRWKKCQFRLLALKTVRSRYHMYGHGRHTCCHADGKREAVSTKSVKARDNEEKEPEEIQAMEEENEQMDVAEESAEMEEQMDHEGNAENVSRCTSKSGDIEEELKEWPIETIQRRLARALRKENADKVIKWMARTGPDTIDAVMAGLDIEQVVKLLEMARKALRGTDKENVSIWLDLVEYALSSRGLELAKVPDLVDGVLSRILRRIERRELLPKRRLKAFRKHLASMRKHMQRVVDLGIFAY